MEAEILQRINAVLGALNRITVCGKANLANLSGSISMLEDIAAIVSDAAEKAKGAAG